MTKIKNAEERGRPRPSHKQGSLAVGASGYSPHMRRNIRTKGKQGGQRGKKQGKQMLMGLYEGFR